MNNNKQIIIILAILLVVAIGTAVYFGYFKDKNKNSQKPKDQIAKDEGKVKSGLVSGKKEFTDASNTFSITFPKDWVVLGKEKLNTTQAKNFDEVIVFGNDPNIFVGINGPKDKDQAYEKDLDGLLNSLIASMEKGFKEKNYVFTVVEKNTGQEQKKDYSYTYLVTKISSEDVENSKSVYQIQKNIISSDKLFAMTASCEADKFEDYQKTLKEIINSFKLK